MATSSPSPFSAAFVTAMPGIFVVLWATGFIGARMGIPYIEPFTFLLLRFLIVGALLVLVALAMRAPWPRSRREAGASVVSGALLHGVYLGGTFWAISRGLPAGVAALIVGLQPLLTALLARPFLGESVDRAHWYGIALGVGGLILVLAPKFELSGGGISPVTVAAVGISVVGIVLGSYCQKLYGGTTDLRTGTFLQYVGGAVVVAVAAVLTEDFRVEWTGELVFAMTWLVLVLSIGAIGVYILLLRRGAIAKVSTLFFLVPPVTALMGWFLFGETLSFPQILGMAVCAAGVALAGRARVPT